MTDDPKTKSLTGRRPGLYYGYVILGAAVLIMVACFGINFAFGIFFKPMLTEFNWTRAVTSGAFSLSWLVTGFVAILAGALNDRFGPRVIITGCGLLLGLGYVLMSQVSTVWQLYLFYGVIIGAGLSVFIPLASTVVRWFTERTSMMTGILVTGTGIAALIGPPIADQLIKAYNWRLSYVIVGIVALVIIIPLAQLLRRDPPLNRQVTSSQSESVKPVTNTWVEFSLKEAAVTGQFWLAFFMFFCLGFCLYSVQVHLAPYVTDLGFSMTTAATILGVMGAATIVGRLSMGAAGDKIGNRYAFVIAFCLMSAALFWLIFSLNTWQFYLFASIFGFAFGGGIAQQSPMIAKLFGLRSLGLIFGVVSLGFSFGASAGPLLTGYIFDTIGGYRIAFIINVVIAVLGLVFTVLVKPARHD